MLWIMPKSGSFFARIGFRVMILLNKSVNGIVLALCKITDLRKKTVKS